MHEVLESYSERLAWGAADSFGFGRLLTQLGLFDAYLQFSREQQVIEWFLLVRQFPSRLFRVFSP